MKCGKCPLSTMIVEDEEDIYLCPFDSGFYSRYGHASKHDCEHEEERGKVKNDTEM